MVAGAAGRGARAIVTAECAMSHHMLIFVGVAFVAGFLWGQQQAAAGNTGFSAII